MDNTGYGANDQVATVNSGFSLINQLKVDFNGVNVLDTPGVNHAINVKNLTELSSSYTETVGPSICSITQILLSVLYLKNTQHYNWQEMLRISHQQIMGHIMKVF